MTLPELALDYKKFLDRTTILYGESGTGKSFFMVDILFQLKPHIEQIIVVSPTDRQNHTYDRGIVPKPCIHYTITPELLTNIWDRQTALAQAYTKANRPEIIKSLFERTPRRETAQSAINGVGHKLKEYTAEILETETDEVAAKSKIAQMEMECTRLINLIYKHQIEENRAFLQKQNLLKDEQFTLKYLYLNPRLALIFDDCTDQLKKLNNHPVMQKLYYQGRWAFITALIACHTDKALLPELKKNSFVNIFTEETCANSYFTRKSNDLDKVALARAQAAIRVAFNASIPFQKLIWVREEKKFYRATATKHDNFKFGSAAIWEFCRLSASENEYTSSDNKFINEFMSP